MPTAWAGWWCSGQFQAWIALTKTVKCGFATFPESQAKPAFGCVLNSSTTKEHEGTHRCPLCPLVLFVVHEFRTLPGISMLQSSRFGILDQIQFTTRRSQVHVYCAGSASPRPVLSLREVGISVA